MDYGNNLAFFNFLIDDDYDSFASKKLLCSFGTAQDGSLCSYGNQDASLPPTNNLFSPTGDYSLKRGVVSGEYRTVAYDSSTRLNDDCAARYLVWF